MAAYDAVPVRKEGTMPEPDETTTLTDDDIQTTVVGDVHSKAGTPGPAASDDSDDSTDTGDDSGDDSGDISDTSDTGDDSGDDSGAGA